MKIGKLLKFAGYLLAGLVGLVVVALAAIYGLSHQRINKLQQVQVRPVTVPVDAAAIEHGRHIAVTRACADCHGADYGGNTVIDDPMAGRLDGPNITRGRGGLPADFSDLDYVRAIRHGLTAEGRSLLLMPSLEYEGMSDEDTGALIAYLKSLPPVDRERGPVSPGPIIRLLILKGEFKLSAEHIDHAAVRPEKVVAEITPAYGRYLAASCIGCHGANFSGGRIPGAPPDWPSATNLTPHPEGAVTTWSEADFIAALRTSMRPDGTALNAVMPAAFGQMTDLELKALWTYLRTLPAAAAGVR